MPVEAPYGTWPSPVSASDLVQGAVGLGYPTAAGGMVFWQESRPHEQGRVALVAASASGGPARDVLPREMSARTLANEYGGRAWAVSGDGRILVTSDFADQRLWDVSPAGAPRPLTPEPATPRSVRYACPQISPDGAWVVAVRESLVDGGARNDLVAVPLAAGEPPRVLASGHDFYSSPTLSPDGARLAFICWDHPHMPWDATQLWQGRFVEGALDDLAPVAGNGALESVLQPKWAPGGELLYISDRTGWWNLYASPTGRALAPLEADFAGPAWTFGPSNYAVLGDGTLVAAWQAAGESSFGTVSGGGARAGRLPYATFDYVAPGGDDGSVLVVAGGPLRPAELARAHLEDGTVEVLRCSQPLLLGEEWISRGKAFCFPTGDGQEAYGLHYPPCNPEFTAPAGELPPLVVTSHGGPTSSASRTFQLRTQYWTTRGFAVVDVDYRGSTGYGRAYREAIYGQMGVVDVDDCAAAALHLVRRGLADPARVVVRGSSSSGLTALAALARHRIFAAAAAGFPVCDLAALAASTHNFESRYIDRLVPPALAAQRSPLAMAAEIAAPVLLLQGLDDKVVPPAQSREMAAALRANGTPVHLVEVEGEGHGFRKATTAVRAQEVELAFFAKVLGIALAGDMAGALADLEAASRPGGTTWA